MRPALAATVLLAGVSLHLAGASGRLPKGTVRLALLSDLHVAGPEYPLNSESSPLDNASITKTQQRLWRAVRAINAIAPAPQLVVIGGDIVHSGLDRLPSLGLDDAGLARLFSESVNGYSIAAELLSQLAAPRLLAWGNHDRLLACGNASASAPAALAARVYRHYFDADPYAAVDVGAWKVVAPNSMLGCTWDPDHPRCNSILSSYGAEQLHWLNAQLDEGRPTVVIAHHPPPTAVRDEVESADARLRDLASVLMAHSNVRLVLSGHFHKGVDWEGLFLFPTRTLPSLRYSPNNFLLLDLHPDGSFELPDERKNRGGARCSDQWSYSPGRPRPAGSEQQPNDPGDCGVPAAGDEADFPLPPVLNASSMPDVPWFNPERSCRFEVAVKFLQACATGPGKDCCEVTESAFHLRSSAPLEACLCQPSFWQMAVDYLSRQHAVSLADMLDSCVGAYGKLIVYRGGPLTWCPGGSSPSSSLSRSAAAATRHAAVS